MRIIPAIDLIDGKCVRLTKGDYSTKKIYNENPLEVAKSFEASGIQYLHLVDLDGAKKGAIVNHKILEEIANRTNLKVDFGGGIRSEDDIRKAFHSGASQITGGSIAVKQPDVFKKWIAKFGGNKVILGADCMDRRIASDAWETTTGPDVIDFISDYSNEGIESVVCTDISKDGALAGPSLELYGEIIEKTNVKLIASGGVTTLEDLIQLKNLGCDGAIIGKAIYEGRITLKDLEKLC